MQVRCLWPDIMDLLRFASFISYGQYNQELVDR